MKTSTCWLIPMVFVFGIVTAQAVESGPADLSDAERAFAYAKLSPIAERYILNDDSLPAFTFPPLDEAAKILGKYRLKSTVYDSEYKLITQASKPGRYGAVVEILPGKRASSGLAPVHQPLSSARSDKCRAAIAGAGRPAQDSALGLQGCPQRHRANALHLAALHEVPRDADPDGFYQQPVEKERQWWIGLKRRLYGFDKHPHFALRPRPLASEGKPAPVIRQGTLAEAGVKNSNAADRIDEVLKRWAGDSDEGFDVCIVRRGVQFADHRLRLDRARGRARHAVGLRLLAVPRAAEGRSAVLHPVDHE